MASRDARRALELLEQNGLLLLHDAKLPSLSALVAGAPIARSWWGHPAGRAIFHAAGELDDHPDVLAAKLVNAKLTFVHRKLFAALIAIGRSRASWQMSGLGRAALRLLGEVDRKKRVRAKGPAKTELETRLLAASRQVHTDSGAHATELYDWDELRSEIRVRRVPIDIEGAKREIESALRALEKAGGGRGKLPWPAPSGRPIKT